VSSATDQPAIEVRARDRRPAPVRGDQADIRYAVWEITLACDLGCKHCGSRAGKARPDELTTEQCLDIVQQLADVGCREVALIGGEAYLREDWDVIARTIVDSGMRCGMTTGARNLDAGRVARAKAAGIDSFSISIDGLEATHDSIRGARGSWRSALEAVDRLRDAGITFGFNTHINRLSMPELPALADLLVEKGGIAWQVMITVAMGRAADRPEMLLQPYDVLELMPLLAWLKASKLEPNKVELQAGNNIGYFGGYEKLIRVGGERGATWSPCTAGLHVLGLEADGKIKGCPSLPSNAYTGGNLKTQRIADLINSAPQLTSLRQRTVDDLWGFCRGCEHAESCLAGCTWTSHVLFGRPGNNPYCIHRAQQFEAQGLRERLVRKTAAGGNPFDHGEFELVVEPCADVAAEATIVGHRLVDIVAANASLASLSTAEQRRAALAKAR
jgi:radical SAM protein with 4Fe4S-binding SPASM domain